MKADALQAAVEVLRNPDRVYSGHEYRAIIASLISDVMPDQDAARFEWALPILTGNDEGDRRTLALAKQFILGLDGREAIDAAMKEVAEGDWTPDDLDRARHGP